MTKEEILKTYYGYDAFRPGQDAMIDALLAGRDALAIMPTGAGKSVCYQVPALLLPGITLVVSPLVSLMRDQVTALVQMGVPAAFLNSTLTYRQYLLALDRARDGWYKIIYVAPERLETEGFRAFAQSADISLVAVDEAHCISQWGQDFRPSYLNIPDFVASLSKRPPIGAFTATATPEVRDDIRRLLQLERPAMVTTGFDRENLYFEVQEPRSKQTALLELVHSRPGKCGIVYCSTRRAVEDVCAFLQEEGISATRYHAGLDAEERRKNQEDFLFDRVQVMVATNAFGMGIDKSDVRYVIHYNMPKDLESYYQEAGRAGRDGAPSSCILLYSGQDVRTARFLIERGHWSACGSGICSVCGGWRVTAVLAGACASIFWSISGSGRRNTATPVITASTIFRRWTSARRPGPFCAVWPRPGSTSALASSQRPSAVPIRTRSANTTWTRSRATACCGTLPRRRCGSASSFCWMRASWPSAAGRTRCWSWESGRRRSGRTAAP